MKAKENPFTTANGSGVKQKKQEHPNTAAQQRQRLSRHLHTHGSRAMTPRHQRIFAALAGSSKGILSFTLREICQCQNVADEVMAMRRQGFKITCELEPYITQDGAKTKIGRYRLDGFGSESARG